MPADAPLRNASAAIAPSASADEAAAIVAAVERFKRATASPPSSASSAPFDGWRHAALREGVSHDPWGAAVDAWHGPTG